MRKYAVGFTTLLALSILFSAIAFSPVHAQTPHMPNSMWVEPMVKNYDSSTPVGTKFNVTVWLNVTSPVNSWQFFLLYNSSHLHALRCDYTGNGKSQWSGTLPVDTVLPDLSPQNASFSYVVHGEVLKSSANKTGAGSLSWIEFNVTYVPPQGVAIASEILLDQVGAFRSLAQDPEFNDIVPALTFDKCNYFIPEFPLTILLAAFFAATTSIALIFRRKSRQKTNSQISCRL
jgi:hypothetical protein